MEEKPKSIEEILKMMEQQLGEEPRPMVLMSKLIPEWIPRQAQERKFVMDLPHIPPKYKHLIMIAASTAVGCHLCTETFIKLADSCIYCSRLPSLHRDLYQTRLSCRCDKRRDCGMYSCHSLCPCIYYLCYSY